MQAQIICPSTQRWIPRAVSIIALPQVCREFQRGNCARGETDCRFAHPSDSPMIDTTDNTVTVCMDYIKSRCSREKCKYFHPPAHLQAKIKSSQQQASQTAITAQAAAAAVVRHNLFTSDQSCLLFKHFAFKQAHWKICCSNLRLLLNCIILIIWWLMTKFCNYCVHEQVNKRTMYILCGI